MKRIYAAGLAALALAAAGGCATFEDSRPASVEGTFAIPARKTYDYELTHKMELCALNRIGGAARRVDVHERERAYPAYEFSFQYLPEVSGVSGSSYVQALIFFYIRPDGASATIQIKDLRTCTYYEPEEYDTCETVRVDRFTKRTVCEHVSEPGGLQCPSKVMSDKIPVYQEYNRNLLREVTQCVQALL